MNSRDLATALSERMREVVPAGFDIRVDDDMIWFADGAGSRSGTYACQVLNAEDGDRQHRLVEACWRALDDLQDFVDESTAEPWPGEKSVPKAGAWIEGEEVVLWYGNAADPALRLRSLAFDPEVMKQSTVE